MKRDFGKFTRKLHFPLTRRPLQNYMVLRRMIVMGYRNLQQCVADLERTGQLVRIEMEIDPYLEMGMIQRRVYENQGPALLFTNVKGCRFPMLGNLFGTLERARWIFRDSLKTIEALVALKINPAEMLKNPASLL